MRLQTHLFFASVLALSSAAALTPAFAEPTSETSSTQSIIIDERELLRRYLRQVEKYSEAQIETELAKLQFQKEVFREYSDRWWDERNEYKEQALRERALNEYWTAYFKGQKHIDDLLERAAQGPNWCKLVKAELASARPSPVDGSSLFPHHVTY